MAKSQKITYREWPNPSRGLTVTEIGLLQYKPEAQKRIWWNPSAYSHLPGRVIPACRKPELIGFFKFSFRRLNNAVSHFHWTKPSQESLSRLKWFYFLSSGNVGSEKIRWLIFKLTCRWGDWITPVIHFDWTRPSQKSLSSYKYLNAPLVRLYH
jgi:hypothetical protein